MPIDGAPTRALLALALPPQFAFGVPLAPKGESRIGVLDGNATATKLDTFVPNETESRRTLPEFNPTTPLLACEKSEDCTQAAGDYDGRFETAPGAVRIGCNANTCSNCAEECCECDCRYGNLMCEHA